MPRLIDADALEKDLNDLRIDAPMCLLGQGIAIWEAAIDRAIIALHEADRIDADPCGTMMDGGAQ